MRIPDIQAAEAAAAASAFAASYSDRALPRYPAAELHSDRPERDADSAFAAHADARGDILTTPELREAFLARAMGEFVSRLRPIRNLTARS